MPDSGQTNNFTRIISNGVKETNRKIISQTTGFISSAFVLVAALAWNEAIKELISQYFKTGSGLVSRLVYALIVTLIAVLVTSRLNKIETKYQAETKDENNQ